MASNTPPLGRRQDRDRLLLRAHAHRFAEAMGPYRADHPVALREAHRLLDTRMRREAILSCIHDIERRAGKAPRRGIYGRFAMPSIRATLPWFRKLVLGELLEGRLVANMCLPDGRRVDVDAERWGYLIPHWDHDRAAYADGELVAREIIVRRQGEALTVPVPLELPRDAGNRPPPAKPDKVQADARVRCHLGAGTKPMKKCLREWRVPSQRDDEEDAKAKFGDRMSRARVRAMREACAPEWESSGKPKGRAAKKTRT